MNTNEVNHEADNKDFEKGISILVAEDNYVNLKVAVKLLEKKGFAVSSAENGVEVIAKYKKESYDIILMDIQMPEMDGYEATKIIRNMENGTNRHIIIIAMTAYAMKGDRDKCIEAGMDDYIPKPVKVDELYSIIDKYSINKRESLKEIDNEYSSEFMRAMDNISGDEELMEELITILKDEYKSMLADIDSAIENKNYYLAFQKSHSLKGTVGNFGADRLRRKIAQMETNLRSEDVSGIDELFSSIVSEIEDLVSFLNNWALNRRNSLGE